MKILELFCGTKSISKAFEKRGHEVFTVDIESSFDPDMCEDVININASAILEKFGRPDVIWASPPCTAFSVASIGHHWTGGEKKYMPKTEYAAISQELVIHTIKIIQELRPQYWFIENPRGLLRKMPFMRDMTRYTVTHCQYGDSRMKPTDIWTNHQAPGFKPICSNGDNCHESAPRGSRTGTQGLKNAKDRAVIPALLCEHMCNICMM